MSKGERTLGVRARTRAAEPARTAVAPAELAWLLALPSTVVLVAAIVLLGPALGRLLFPTLHVAFWNTGIATLAVRPEPTEQGRYVIAIAGPVARAPFTSITPLREENGASSLSTPMPWPCIRLTSPSSEPAENRRARKG